MPRLPSRPDDPCCQSARSQLLAGHQRHIMIQPTRLLIDLAQNSNPSSQRNRLVTQSSEPFAVAQESHVLPLCSTGEFFQRSPPSSIEQSPAACSLFGSSESLGWSFQTASQQGAQDLGGVGPQRA